MTTIRIRPRRLALAFGTFTALATASSAAPQDPIYWDGLAHTALGSATVGNGGGGLAIFNIGSMGLDGVDTRMPPPPPAGFVIPPQYNVSLGAIDANGTLPAGASLRFTARGTFGGAPNQELTSLEAVKQPGGGVAYTPDFSGLGAATYAIEIYDGPVLVFSAGGLTGGPVFLTKCDADPICCWLGAVTYVGGHWVATTACPVDVDHGGGTHSTNRVVLIPENVPAPDDLTSVSMHASDIPSLVFTDETTAGFGTLGSNYCVGEPNSTGSGATIFAQGSDVVSDNDVSLNATGMPTNKFGYFLASPNQGFIPNVSGSAGNFCLGTGSTLGRFRAHVQNSGASGTFALHIDLTEIPIAVAPGSVALQPGDTWNFQAWYRDVANGNNFTDGVSLTFF